MSEEGLSTGQITSMTSHNGGGHGAGPAQGGVLNNFVGKAPPGAFTGLGMGGMSLLSGITGAKQGMLGGLAAPTGNSLIAGKDLSPMGKGV